MRLYQAKTLQSDAQFETRIWQDLKPQKTSLLDIPLEYLQ